MKSFLISISIILAVISTAIWNAARVNQIAAELLEHVIALPESIDTVPDRDAVEKAIASTKALWDKQSPYLDASLNHLWILSVNAELLRCRESFLSDSPEDYRNARAALIEAIRYFSRRETLSLGNLI